ncbi:Techylectin-5A [Araneus ventricosus]|uniref:Techylectin-5A n=1 Tax=Araneus ventricosus TaxID=182803 RepID=A0A4Y2ES92_ARAVE|nr:Techylectin-5A [Araneus ventricosus]
MIRLQIYFYHKLQTAIQYFDLSNHHQPLQDNQIWFLCLYPQPNLCSTIDSMLRYQSSLCLGRTLPQQNMWIANISLELLFLVILAIIKAHADSAACEQKEKTLALLDFAKESIKKAKDLQPHCISDSKNTSFNGTECGAKEKVSAFLDLARNLIEEAKENYPNCDVSKDLTKVVEKNITKVVEGNITKVVEGNITKVVEKNITKDVLPPPKKAADCSEILENGEKKSGEYTIWPSHPNFSGKELKVFCDMETDGGGWTVIQRRGDFPNKVDFYRNWSDYKNGFGNISEEFWLGNDNIFALTNQGTCTVRFDMKSVDKEYRFATYSDFRIEDENGGYKLHYGDYQGTAGDGIKEIKNMEFSTKDKKYQKSNTGCPAMRSSGWWFNNCGSSNLNGINNPDGKESQKYMNWRPFTKYRSLLSVEIKIRKQK